jgi:hypothetical protein
VTSLPHEIHALGDFLEQHEWDVDIDDGLIAERGDEQVNIYHLDDWQVVYRDDEEWRSVASRHDSAAAANDFVRKLLRDENGNDYDELPEPLRGFAHGLSRDWTVTCGTEGAVYLRVEEKDLELAKTDDGRYAVHDDAEGRTLLTADDFALAAEVFHDELED